MNGCAWFSTYVLKQRKCASEVAHAYRRVDYITFLWVDYMDTAVWYIIIILSKCTKYDVIWRDVKPHKNIEPARNTIKTQVVVFSSWIKKSVSNTYISLSSKNTGRVIPWIVGQRYGLETAGKVQATWVMLFYIHSNPSSSSYSRAEGLKVALCVPKLFH